MANEIFDNAKKTGYTVAVVAVLYACYSTEASAPLVLHQTCDGDSSDGDSSKGDSSDGNSSDGDTVDAEIFKGILFSRLGLTSKFKSSNY